MAFCDKQFIFFNLFKSSFLFHQKQIVYQLHLCKIQNYCKINIGAKYQARPVY